LRRRFACAAAIAGAATVFAAGGAQAAVMNFDGQQIRVTEFLGDATLPTAEEVVLVDESVELSDFGSGSGGFLSFDIDIGASTIEFVSNDDIPQAPGTFGFTFADDMDAIMRILTASVTSSEGYTGLVQDSVRVVDGGNGIVVDFENVGIAADSRLQIDVAFAESPSGVIPLPATLPLALGGFALLAGLGRRRG
jgi:hypothetical protein